MKLRCLIFGCRWEPYLSWKDRGEQFHTHKCERCGAYKTEAV